MLHRDQECRNGSCTHAQELSLVIQGLLPELEGKGVQFRKDCGWAVSGLAAAALLWAWSSKKTLADRFEQALKVAQAWGRGGAPRKTSYQSFVKMLVRWTGALRPLVSVPPKTPCPLLLIDGERLSYPSPLLFFRTFLRLSS